MEGNDLAGEAEFSQRLRIAAAFDHDRGMPVRLEQGLEHRPQPVLLTYLER